jgi:hypothetical protein
MAVKNAREVAEIAPAGLEGVRTRPKTAASPDLHAGFVFPSHRRGIFTPMTSESQSCPFFRPDNAVCAASMQSRIPPLSVRVSRCTGEEYESCATFLARLLSSLRLYRR